MTSKTFPIEQGLDIYKQSPSLLFQFILDEFLQTAETTRSAEKIYRKIERSIIRNRLLAHVTENLHQLLDSLSLLIGSHMSNDKSTPWDKEQGSLSKLHEYCYLFNVQANVNPRASENLNNCVSQAYHSSLQSREAVLAILQHKQKEETADAEANLPDYANLYKLLDDLLDNLQRASRLILQIIMSCHEDENIIFFIFKNQDRMKACYPAFSLPRLLDRMFPNGLKDAKNFLLNRYAERGFKDLIEEITFLSSKIEGN
ncbi:MAG: hypothetical protein GWP59_00940 [Chlamydiales bacterium]|nr:hypothetical protein [Chlamydiales bacterium]NCF70243.1 hypothetical protein [Chlamydiales bacterium]